MVLLHVQHAESSRQGGTALHGIEKVAVPHKLDVERGTQCALRLSSTEGQPQVLVACHCQPQDARVVQDVGVSIYHAQET